MTTEDVHDTFRAFSSTHWVRPSAESTASGDVVAVRPRRPEHVEIERGRVLQVTCTSAGGRLYLVGIHNFEIGGHAMRRVAAALRESESRHAAAPHS